MIARCPKNGQGVNAWTISTALSLLARGATESEAQTYLHKHTSRTDSRTATAEIERALSRAADYMSQDSSNRRIKESWPTVNQSKYLEIVSNGGGVSELLSLSPVKDATAQDVLPLLFPGNPLLWCARKIKPEIADTQPLSVWLPIATHLQYIVPSPMVSRVIQPGYYSRRCLANVGPRKYLVIESDHGSVNEQASVLLHLAKYLPFAMAVSSGGKSVHGWFLVSSFDESKVRRFMELAVSLKADSSSHDKSHALRMPGGLRDTGKRQSILFFNPAALEGRAE